MSKKLQPLPKCSDAIPAPPTRPITYHVIKKRIDHSTDREEKLALRRIEVSNLHLEIRQLRDAIPPEIGK